jgi:tRNA A37 threonylcarbamoyladenosine modification protein TsaB
MSRLNALSDGIVVPMLDARMDEVFGAIYRFVKGQREKLTPDRVCTVETLLAENCLADKSVIAIGDGALRYHERIHAIAPQAFIADAFCGIPRADAVAREAYALLRAGINTDAALVAPRYLRASQAEQAREQRLAKESAASAIQREG